MSYAGSHSPDTCCSTSDAPQSDPRLPQGLSGSRRHRGEGHRCHGGPPKSGHQQQHRLKSACRVLRTARRGRLKTANNISRSRRPWKKRHCIGDRPTRAGCWGLNILPAWRSGSSGNRVCAQQQVRPWSRPGDRLSLAFAVENRNRCDHAGSPGIDQSGAGTGHRKSTAAPALCRLRRRATEPQRQWLLRNRIPASAATVCLHCRQSDRPRGSAAGAAKRRTRYPSSSAESAPQRSAQCGAVSAQ